jgi:hypothetical protein
MYAAFAGNVPPLPEPSANLKLLAPEDAIGIMDAIL